MKNIKTRNGLVTWNSKEIMTRNWIVEFFTESLKERLSQLNRHIRFIQCESPLLIETSLINNNYTPEDFYFLGGKEDLSLRPETTSGSYLVAMEEMNDISPPIVVWQYGKSFRREQDAPMSRMKLKEFYQLEYQLIYTSDSKAPYYDECIKIVSNIFRTLFKTSIYTERSDRLPNYSNQTTDILFKKGDYELELCSISDRSDFPGKFNDKDLRVAEIAIGLDRCVFCNVAY